MSSEAAVQGAVGSAVVILHVPAQLQLNVDLTTWKVPADSADCFVVTGIKAGAHYVGWRNETVGRVEGLMTWLSPRQVAVFEWVEKLEVLIPVRDEEELFRYQRGHDNLSLLHKSVMYPHDQWATWEAFTYAIVPQLIENVQIPLIESFREKVQLQPIKPLEDVDIDDYKRTLHNTDTSGTQAAGLGEEDDGSQFPLSWTDQPEHPKQFDTSQLVEDWCGAISMRMTDWTQSKFDAQLLSAVARHLHLTEAETLFIGELQLAFVHFAIGCNLSAFQQWKAYYVTLPLANIIYDKNVALGCHWMRILAQQLSRVPDDFHLSDLTENNFIIAAALDTLEYTIDHHEPKIKQAAQALKSVVEKIFKMSWVELSQLQKERFVVVE